MQNVSFTGEMLIYSVHQRLTNPGIYLNTSVRSVMIKAFEILLFLIRGEMDNNLLVPGSNVNVPKVVAGLGIFTSAGFVQGKLVGLVYKLEIHRRDQLPMRAIR